VIASHVMQPAIRVREKSSLMGQRD